MNSITTEPMSPEKSDEGEVEFVMKAPLSEKSARYTNTAIVLHWAIAVLVITQIGMGLVMDHGLVSEEKTFSLFQIHRALGMLTLLLVVLRCLWRLFHRPPPSGLTRFVTRIAGWVHGLLYACQLLSPLSGWALASASSLAIPLSMFGFFDWPLLPMGQDGRYEDTLRFVHHWVGWIFAALIVLHGSAAFLHGVLCRDGTVGRMIPYRNR